MSNLIEFESMTHNELWKIYEGVAIILARKMMAEKIRLDAALQQIEARRSVHELGHGRRQYPVVLPKYQNPDNPLETWSGRGKQPLWLTAQLRAGKTLSDCLIARISTSSKRARRSA